MVPIHELLSRIRWDPEFGTGEFTIGYEDHVRGIVRVPLQQLRIEPGQHFMFGVVDEEGVERQVPFHRVREVLRDGKLIWQRAGPSRR